MRPNPVYGDVVGAPFKIGERVRVTRGQDETFDALYKRHVGIVEYFEYSCGCGQSYPHDPMVGVRFHDESVAEFWAEELRRHHERARKHQSRAASRERVDG